MEDFFTGDEFVDSTKTFKKILNDENFKSIYEADFNKYGKKDYLVNLAYKKSFENNDVVKNYIGKDNYQAAISHHKNISVNINVRFYTFKF